jgi:hypothetical protein
MTPLSALIAGLGLPRDYSVRFPNGAAFVAGSLSGVVGDFRPELFPRCRLVRVPFGIIRSPRHQSGSRKWLAFHFKSYTDAAASTQNSQISPGGLISIMQVSDSDRSYPGR